MEKLIHQKELQCRFAKSRRCLKRFHQQNLSNINFKSITKGRDNFSQSFMQYYSSLFISIYYSIHFDQLIVEIVPLQTTLIKREEDLLKQYGLHKTRELNALVMMITLLDLSPNFQAHYQSSVFKPQKQSEKHLKKQGIRSLILL